MGVRDPGSPLIEGAACTTRRRGESTVESASATIDESVATTLAPRDTGPGVAAGSRSTVNVNQSSLCPRMESGFDGSATAANAPSRSPGPKRENVIASESIVIRWKPRFSIRT